MATNSVPMMVSRADGAFTWPRRQCIDQLIPAELTLLSAVQHVDALGADERLTDIVVRLGELRDRLADWAESTGNIKPEGGN